MISLVLLSQIIYADIFDDIKKSAKKTGRQFEKFGRDVKHTAQDVGKDIQTDVIDPLRKSSLEIEHDLAQTFGIKVNRYNFVILNATPITMNIELEKLDVLLLTAGATSVAATVATAPLPKNIEHRKLNPGARTVFSTPDKSFCWKYGQAIYTNKSGRVTILPLKKDHVAKCENLYAAIVLKKDEQGNPLKDIEGNYIIEVKRDNSAKEFIKNYKPENELKLHVDKLQ